MTFLDKYTDQMSDLLKSLDDTTFFKAEALLRKLKANNGKLVIAGNGGSAAISSHISVDFTKACGIRAVNFNEADLITCFANDYGYENWIVEALKAYLDPEDLVILISSSGTSKNIVNAAHFCKKSNVKLITLSGFEKQNPLSLLGDLNVWVDTSLYNFIEMVHHIWLVGLVDKIALGEEACFETRDQNKV